MCRTVSVPYALSDIGKTRKGRKDCRLEMLPRASPDGGIGEHGRQRSRLACEPGGKRQGLRLQKARIEQPGLIARAMVAEDRHDRMTWPQLFGEAHRPGDVAA